SKNTFYSAASQFFVEGGFNVNSTSVEAWKAILSAARDLDIPRYNLSGTSAGAFDKFSKEEKAAFSRMINPVGDAFTGGTDQEFWYGYRALSDTEIDALAKAIVAELQTTGKPFASLSAFVNRPLEKGTATGRNRAGILQRAIDATSINNSVPGSTI